MRSVFVSVAFTACFIVPVFAGPAFAGPVFAGDDLMAGYEGNTAISTGGMAEVHTYYGPDHTFVMNVPAYSLRFKGTWAVNGTQVCFTYEVPPPGISNPDCSPIESHKVGDSWVEKADDGQRKLTLVSGLQ